MSATTVEREKEGEKGREEGRKGERGREREREGKKVKEFYSAKI